MRYSVFELLEPFMQLILCANRGLAPLDAPSQLWIVIRRSIVREHRLCITLRINPFQNSSINFASDSGDRPSRSSTRDRISLSGASRYATPMHSNSNFAGSVMSDIEIVSSEFTCTISKSNAICGWPVAADRSITLPHALCSDKDAETTHSNPKSPSREHFSRLNSHTEICL